MSWPRGSRLAALLILLSPLASADSITVNTTTDDNASNNLCSLREAVEYFNRDKPDGGWQGCVRNGTASTTDTITLPADTKPYAIDSAAITIRRDLTITGAGSKGDSITTLQVNGAHRAFIVNDTPSYIAPLCGQAVPTTCSQPASGGKAAAPDLDPTTSYATNQPHNYLISVVRPTFTGTVMQPASSNLQLTIAVYDNPKTGDPVQIGTAIVNGVASPGIVSWTVTSARTLAAGVHFISYTTQLTDTTTNISDPASDQSNLLTVAIAVAPPRRSVTLSQMVIKGCGIATGCDDNANDTTTIINDENAAGYDPYSLSYYLNLTNTYDTATNEGRGGIIYSNESLVLQNDALQGGVAAGNGAAGGAGKGGAVYLDVDGNADISLADVRNNTATRGGAVYSAKNDLTVAKSLFTLNTVGLASGAVIEVADSTAPSDLNPGTSIENVTLSGNAGLALSLQGTANLNASTVILNSGGLDFNAGFATVYNSILADNGSQDCINLPAVPVIKTSLLFPVATGACPADSSDQVIDNVSGTATQLMATLDANGKCNSDFGLLCPLADNGGATMTHLPRILASYGALSESPIANKASTVTGSQQASACPSQDQREKSRVANACDIGAVQLQAVAGNVLSGGSISYGGTWKEPLSDNLGDEELLPVAECPAAPPTPYVAGSYRSDVPGCPWLEAAPGRGTVVFNTDGSYSYTPAFDFHGFDRFTARVMTTLSKLNSEPVSQSRVISAQVIVQPASGISSSSLGGALDGCGVLLLGLLGLGRRCRRGE
jgi:rhombotarget A family protien